MKRVLLILIVIALCVGCRPPNEDTTRILFIGNSYTYFNNLPKMFANLSKSGGHRLEVGMETRGGWTLEDHVESVKTLERIRTSEWDYVVLQEQSQIPASTTFRQTGMVPAVRMLAAQVREVGAIPILFLTPAHLDGWPAEEMDYESMQAEINISYWGLAGELDAPVAPAGIAWYTAHGQKPEEALWQADNSHPTRAGTYLTACVFYATIFHESPIGLTYRANLPKETAEWLQTIASQTVMGTP